jgi:hypothetical protein
VEGLTGGKAVPLSTFEDRISDKFVWPVPIEQVSESNLLAFGDFETPLSESD